MKKKILFIIICLVLLLPKASADEKCTYTELNRIRTLASLIKMDIKYIGETSEDEYGISFSDVSDDFYIYIDGKHYFGDSVVKNLKSKTAYKVSIYVYDNACFNEFSYVRYIKIPPYNSYYKSQYCIGHEDIDLCQIDYDSSDLTEEQFKKKIRDYIESQSENNFQYDENKKSNNNLVFIILGIVVVFIILVVIAINFNKKRKRLLL